MIIVQEKRTKTLKRILRCEAGRTIATINDSSDNLIMHGTDAADRTDLLTCWQGERCEWYKSPDCPPVLAIFAGTLTAPAASELFPGYSRRQHMLITTKMDLYLWLSDIKNQSGELGPTISSTRIRIRTFFSSSSFFKNPDFFRFFFQFFRIYNFRSQG